MIKPGIPKGTRDFSPTEVTRRNYLFNVIREVFSLHGFLPLETPAMENLETLAGKYGDEGDKLIFRILNSGDYLEKVRVKRSLLKDSASLSDEEEVAASLLFDQSGFTRMIAEKALRYDLTVPFARYVVQHRNDITLPFRRYQIQPVWRADRPQKGRYREFYQCDADIIGSTSLLNECDLVQVFDEVFTRLRIPVTLKINNRKILQGMAAYAGIPDQFVQLTVVLDKLEKAGPEKVRAEMSSRGFSEETIGKIFSLTAIEGDPSAKLVALGAKVNNSVMDEGISEIRYILDRTGTLRSGKIEVDLTLARGLDYYTGCIFEVKADAGNLSSSLCGGGRYDDLTGIFGLEGLSGVGISFGADRIYDVLLSLNKFPGLPVTPTRLLLVNFGEREVEYCLQVASEVRAAGIPCEIYPDAARIKKQMAYADTLGIPYVALAGSEEISRKGVVLKDMKSGEQQFMDIAALVAHIS